MAEVKFDVSGVLPFPMRDPHIEGLQSPNGKPRKRVELPPEQERYRIFTVDELNEWPPVRWLIDGYIAVGELSVLYGAGGTYKSFLALEWAARIANAGSPVVYIVAEGASGMRVRVHAWLKHHGVADLSSLYLMPANLSIHTQDQVSVWVEAMRSQLDGINPALVVVDTLARNFVGGSENNPQDMGMFVDGLERIRMELETAVLVIHHTTKDGKSERGTESLRNASFAMLRMSRTNSRSVALDCDRMKEAEPPDRLALHSLIVPLPELGKGVDSLVIEWPDSPPKQQQARGKSGGELTPAQHKALTRLLEVNQEVKGGVSRDAVAKAFRVSPNNVSRKVKPLLDAGFLGTTGTTKAQRYFVTDAGREALG